MVQGKKTPRLRNFKLENEHLPRQTRDRHIGTTQKRHGFAQAHNGIWHDSPYRSDSRFAPSNYCAEGDCAGESGNWLPQGPALWRHLFDTQWGLTEIKQVRNTRIVVYYMCFLGIGQYRPKTGLNFL